MATLNIQPDWYTKILLDNQGNVLNADYINEDDLPNHTHDVQDITGGLTDLIANTLASFFANNLDSAVVFDYDRNTKTITADLRYDGLTIDKNEDGELMAMGGGSGGVITTPECATHTHLHTSIEDWEEAIKKAIEMYQVPVDVSQFVDNVTIIKNENGTLSAIGVGVAAHTHTIADITDFPEETPATVQPVHHVSLVEVPGPVNLDDLTIGQSIYALNYYLGLQEDRIDNLVSQINRLTLTSGNSNAVANFSISDAAICKILYNKLTNTFEKVYLNKGLFLELDALPYADCYLCMILDDVEVERVKTVDLIPGAVVGRFKHTKTVQRGASTAKVITYNLTGLPEGCHTFQLKYDLGDVVDHSDTIQINLCNTEGYTLTLVDCNPIHTIHDVDYYNNPFDGRFILKATDYNSSIYTDTSLGLDSLGEAIIFLDPGIQTFENLFKVTTLPDPCTKEIEWSDSWVYSHLESTTKGYVLYNTFYPIGTGTLAIRIPNSNLSTGVKITGLPNTARLTVQKGPNKITDSQIFDFNDDTNTGGLVKQPMSKTKVLAFNNVYDDGLQDMVVSISTNIPIDTAVISVATF